MIPGRPIQFPRRCRICGGTSGRGERGVLWPVSPASWAHPACSAAVEKELKANLYTRAEWRAAERLVRARLKESNHAR